MCNSPKNLTLTQKSFPVNEYIKDVHGRIVIYHGLNISNFSKHSGENRKADTGWQSQQDMIKMKDWGFNFCRYLIFWEAIEPSRGTYDTAYINRTIERLKWLGDAGVDVVLDIHQDLYAQRYSGNGFPDWTIADTTIPFKRKEPWNANYRQPVVQNAYKNFWESKELKHSYIEMLQYVMKAIDTIPNVIGIDVMNEPFPDNFLTFEKKTLTKFYRKIDKIFIDSRLKLFYEPWMGTSAGIPSGLRFVPKSNAVYFPHFYDPIIDNTETEYKSGNNFIMRLAMMVRAKEAQKARVPFIIGEWGISKTKKGNLNYIKDFLNTCDAARVGNCYWSFDKESYNDYGILNDDGSLAANMKELVRIYPQKIAGTDPRWHFDGKVFNLTYIPIKTSAPTEITIPKGWNVKIEFDGRSELKDRILYMYPSGSQRQRMTIQKVERLECSQ